jgi:hypothetical protein
MEARWGLWFKVAGESYSPRTIYHPITKSDHPLPEGQYEYEEVMSTDSEPGYTIAWPIKDFKRQSPPIRILGYQTFPEKDYRQQGKRYALFTAELIARIQATPPKQEQATTGKRKEEKVKGTYSPNELGIAIAGVLHNKKIKWTAVKVAAEINHKCETKTISRSAVGAHPTFVEYLRQNGRTRGAKRTGTRTQRLTDKLVDDLSSEVEPSED